MRFANPTSALSGTIASTTDKYGLAEVTASRGHHSTPSGEASVHTAEGALSTPPPAEDPQSLGYAVNGTASDSTVLSQAQYMKHNRTNREARALPNRPMETEQPAIPPQRAVIGAPLLERRSEMDLDAGSPGATPVERAPTVVERHAQQPATSILLPAAGTQGQVDPVAAKKPAERHVRIASTERPSHIHTPEPGRRIDRIRAHLPTPVLKGLLGRDVAPYAIKRLRQRASGML